MPKSATDAQCNMSLETAEADCKFLQIGPNAMQIG